MQFWSGQLRSSSDGIPFGGVLAYAEVFRGRGGSVFLAGGRSVSHRDGWCL